MRDQKEIEDSNMVITLHNVARAMEQNQKDLSGISKELRLIADRLSELTKKAADRRQWCDGTE